MYLQEVLHTSKISTQNEKYMKSIELKQKTRSKRPRTN